MPGNAIAEKGARTGAARAVINLIGQYHIPRRDRFLHNPHRADRQQVRYAHLLHRMHIGAIGHFRGQQHMPSRMAWQEVRGAIRDARFHNRVRGIAKRRVQVVFRHDFRAVHVIDARAANHAQSNDLFPHLIALSRDLPARGIMPHLVHPSLRLRFPGCLLAPHRRLWL